MPLQSELPRLHKLMEEKRHHYALDLKPRVQAPTLEGARAAAAKALGGPTDDVDWGAYENAIAWVVKLEADQPAPVQAGGSLDHAYQRYLDKGSRDLPATAVRIGLLLVGLIGIVIGTIFASFGPTLLMFFASLMGVGSIIRSPTLSCYLVIAFGMATAMSAVTFNAADTDRIRYHTAMSQCERHNIMIQQLNRTIAEQTDDPRPHIPYVDCKAS